MYLCVSVPVRVRVCPWVCRVLWAWCGLWVVALLASHLSPSPQATKNPFYLHVGMDILQSLEKHTRVK